MIQKLLVANRGEIAARVFRTCDRLAIETVAVCAPDDRGSFHTRRAREVRAVGSYLFSEDLVRAALDSGADAIHPGYGFLAESADFADAVQAAGLRWVGPPPDVIRSAGDKLEAKRLAASAAVPVVSAGTLEEIGLPLLVKAAAAGGGRGMRLVRHASELDAALEAASREALATFGDGTVFLERYLERPRHVEVQLLADSRGSVVALGERECSIQRRHQKILEETPSPALDDELRAELVAAAVAVARTVGYEGAGTVEFLLDTDRFFFLELNARIQVEHPVTEEAGGLDLVEHQLRIAAGEALAVAWTPEGHAIEARLYAEHPRSFVPQPGRIEELRLPEGIRVDAGVDQGDEVPAGYDPMIAKLIAHAPSRASALDLLAVALAETRVTGVVTNLPFLRWLVAHPDVRAGETTTAFLAEHPSLSAHRRPRGPWGSYWRLDSSALGDRPRPPAPPEVEETVRALTGAGGAGTELTAPTPGTIVRILASEGETVEAGQPIVILEAMKMENSLVAPFDAVVGSVRVTEGERVAGGTVLVELQPGARTEPVV